MTTITTVEEVSKFLNIKKRSARARLTHLIRKGKAKQTNPKVSPNSPGIYELYIPLKDLFMNYSDVQLQRNGKVNYKKFCADPFNLGRGAR